MFQGLDLMAVCNSGFNAVGEDRDRDRMVDGDFCAQMEVQMDVQMVRLDCIAKNMHVIFYKQTPLVPCDQ